MIAALFVRPRGCYVGLPDVDPWPEARDARTYPGPHPVVAHPPCERWGAYATGGPRYPGAKVLGDDGGCFAAALAAVRVWGGVLEHPRGSRAWGHFGIAHPPAGGGWLPVGPPLFGGRSAWTCCVEQGHYGHRAEKATWLYYVGRAAPPELRWGASWDPDPPDCPYPLEVRTRQKPPKGGGQAWRDQRRAWLRWRRAQGLRGTTTPELMSRGTRAATPTAFRDLLLELARKSF